MEGPSFTSMVRNNLIDSTGSQLNGHNEMCEWSGMLLDQVWRGVGRTMLGALSIFLLSSCAWLSSTSSSCYGPDRVQGPIIHLSQCLTAADQREFYQTPQGSLLIPYDVGTHIELPDSTDPFFSPKNIDRWRFLPNENGEVLPIGFVKEPIEKGMWKGDWIGLNCAACHTTQIEHDGKKIRIDGGPSLADLLGFVNELDASIEATYHDGLENGTKFDRLAKKLPHIDRAALLEHLGSIVQERRAWHARNDYKPEGKVTTHGYGRLDAFGLIFNEMSSRPLSLHENIAEPMAPVSYPFLWDTHYHDWTQWNGASPAIPRLRNISQVIGAFGKLVVDPYAYGGFFDHHASSFRLENLQILQDKVQRLRSPKWPESLFGAINERAKRGKELFDKHCFSCHALQPRDESVRHQHVTMVQVRSENLLKKAHLDTDPLTAERAIKEVSEADGDRTTRVAQLGTVSAGEAVGFRHPLSTFRVLTFVVSHLFDHFQRDIATCKWKLFWCKDAQFFRLVHPTIRNHEPAYKARPLDGIWATAPYLHNGSVPNLYELLLPPEKRSKTFYVGSRMFDPVKVGYITIQESGNESLLDTTIPGNHNTGHVYGTDLSEEDRWALVEYQKTL